MTKDKLGDEIYADVWRVFKPFEHLFHSYEIVVMTNRFTDDEQSEVVGHLDGVEEKILAAIKEINDDLLVGTGLELSLKL